MQRDQENTNAMFKIRGYEIYPHLFYDPEGHFWLKVENNRAKIGMDPVVQESMGAFVVVQIDELGKTLSKGKSFGTVEAEKYVGPLRAPVSGVVKKRNEQVTESPRLANTDPYGEGWLIELELTNFAEESSDLVTGERPLRDWFEKEIKKYEDSGWLAQL
ncbi:MAG: glycine cleavage system protein H [bacterium]